MGAAPLAAGAGVPSAPPTKLYRLILKDSGDADLAGETARGMRPDHELRFYKSEWRDGQHIRIFDCMFPGCNSSESWSMTERRNNQLPGSGCMMSEIMIP